jgi:hypothetical protein
MDDFCICKEDVADFVSFVCFTLMEQSAECVG